MSLVEEAILFRAIMRNDVTYIPMLSQTEPYIRAHFLGHTSLAAFTKHIMWNVHNGSFTTSVFMPKKNYFLIKPSGLVGYFTLVQIYLTDRTTFSLSTNKRAIIVWEKVFLSLVFFQNTSALFILYFLLL